MKKQRYITAGMTVAAAALTAHIMQSGGQGAPGSAQISAAASAAPVPALEGPQDAAPVQAENEQAENEATVNEVTVVTELAAGAAPEADAAPIDGIVLTDAPQAPEGASGDLGPAQVAPAEQEPFVLAAASLPGLPAPAPQPAEPADTPDTPDSVDLVTLEPPEQAQEEAAPVVAAAAPAVPDPVVPVLPSDVVLPVQLPATQADLAARVSTLEAELETPLADQTQRNEFGISCGPVLSATASDQAIVTLKLSAPCRGDARILVRHDALEFTGRVDALGAYEVDVPALAEEAGFSVAFDDGALYAAFADVPAVVEFERVALVADAASGLQIHALEFGAGYGAQGHVWAERPGDPTLAPLEGGGYMVVLGDAGTENPVLSQVYTFPRDGAAESGVVRLSVEAEVTLQNCAKDVTGHTVEPGMDGMPKPVSMTVAIPDCNAVGEYLVLKNLLRDLRIASR